MTKKRTHTPYDYATILAAWETYPMRRIRFNKGETGWIAQLSATEGCLANIPLTGTHAIYDIVEILPATTQDGWSRMGQVGT